MYVMRVLIVISAIPSLFVFMPLIGTSNILYAQLLNDLTNSDTISTEVVPQGTSLQNASVAENMTHTNSRNATIEAEVVPQGTALQTLSEATNDTQTALSDEESIEASVLPQGTSLNVTE